MGDFRPVLPVFALLALVWTAGPSLAQGSQATPVSASAAVAWTTTGGPGLPFNDPFQLAIDPEGNLWVADGNNSRFQIFAPDGTFLESWGELGTDEGEFDFVDPNNEDLTGAAAFGNDAIYVLDAGNDRVQKFTPEREFVLAWGSEGRGDGQFLHPFDIAVDGDGRVLVIDDIRDDVQVFDGDGAFLFSFGGHGSAPGKLFDTGGIAAAADGTIWIADWGANRLQTFAPDGRFLAEVGTAGTAEGRLFGPIDIAIDGEGLVSVTENGNFRVQVFDKGGHSVATFGRFGTQAGRFTQPAGIAIAADGTIYVSDLELDRVTAFRPLGVTAASAAATPAPAQAPATPAAAATPIAATAIIAAEFVWEATGGNLPLSYPMDATIDPEGNIWVVDMANSQFQIFSPDGEFLEAWGSEGDGPGEFRFFAGPVAWETEFGGDVAFDREGNIYVADLANSRVQKFAPDRTFLAEWGEAGDEDGQFQRPWSLDIDEGGNVYVADYTRNNVQVFTGDGEYLRTLAAAGGGEGALISAASVVVAPDGTVWVSDYDGTLIALTPEGELIGEYGEYGVDEGEFDSPNVGDAGNGYVFVADAANNRVQVFDDAGQFVTAWGSEGEGPGEFRGPVGVALDGDGNAYVVDIGNHRVQKFRLHPPLSPTS